MAWYDVGTISVTNGSTTITGTGTDFISGVQVGEGLYIGGDLYEIATIVSGTELTLADAYLGSTATGQDYKIIPTQSLVADLSSGVADLISDFADVRDYAGNGKFNDGSVSSPAITFTQDQNNGLYRIGSDHWGLVAGGVKVADVTTGGIEFSSFNIAGEEVTATVSELNILDGVTSTTSELNILDGLTATTAELNYVDGVTSSIQTQLDTISSTADSAVQPNDDVTLNNVISTDLTTNTLSTNQATLKAIAETKAETAVDVFVYDTTKDSDGGAWRQRTQHTSWYNETLNTATRGSRKEFPAVAVIVAESEKVTIYDGDDPSMPMWMVFNTGVNNGYNFIITGSITSVACKNGLISIGRLSIVAIDFIGDRAQYIANTTQGDYSGHNISQRNEYGDIQNGVNWLSDSYIINGTVNDVAMTVLPDAPIDPATGLPIPTIAVATDGGVSVIKDDGTVVDITGTNWGNRSYKVSFDNKGILYFNQWSYYWLSVDVKDLVTDVSFGDGRNYPSIDRDKYPFKQITCNDYGEYGAKYDAPAWFDGFYNMATRSGSGTDLKLSRYSYYSRNHDEYLGNDYMLYNHISSTYNTGWMNGDIKLATLSDTDDTDLVGSELVTNGTFDSDISGWTAGNSALLTHSTDKIVVTNNGVAYGFAYQQITGLTAGKAYTIYWENPASSAFAKISVGSVGGGGLVNATDVNSKTFVATGTSTYVNLWAYASNTSTAVSFDNISVRLAEPDRSVNNNGLQVFGTVQKNPVATGADLVAYSGFSATNYLQGIIPALRTAVSTNAPFSFSFWFDRNDVPMSRVTIFEIGSLANPDSQFIRVLTDGSGALGVWVKEASGDASYPASALANLPSLVTVNYNGDGTFTFHINGKLSGVTEDLSPKWPTVTDDMVLTLGTTISGSSYLYPAHKMALFRYSNTIPTAEQIKKIYEDEKVLFQEGAQATLYGTSDAVTALAYDDTTELLHVGTSSGRSVFQGLKRVDNTTDAVGTAISASNNLVVEE